MVDKSVQRLAGLTAQQRALLFQQLKERQGKEKKSETVIPLQSRAENAFPLSFAQQRLWFLDQLEPGSSLYTIPQILRLRGSLQAGALRHAVAALVARHETLRTRFTITDGVPRQVVAEQGNIHFMLVDLDIPDAPIREEQARKIASAEVQRPFNLSTGPLLRVTVLRLSTQEHLLLLVMHHIISDAWSSAILLQELFTLMDGFAHERAVQLPPLPVQYVDFAVWQQKQLQGASLEHLLAYWKEQLVSIPMLQLPFDHPRPAEQTFHGAVESLLLSTELTERLRTLTQQEDCTLFMTLLAAFKALLYRYTGQQDITVGSLIANRTYEEIEGIIGFFVNTLVLHTFIEESLTFRVLLARVREVCLGAYAHQNLPFERLVDELQPERSLSYAPLFQVLFTLQNAPEAKTLLSGLEIDPLDFGPSVAKFDLSLYVSEQPQSISMTAEYNTDLFEASTIQRLLAHFQTLLESYVAAPDSRIVSIPLLRQDERQYVLNAWNATAQEYPAKCSLHQLFEQQVAATPETVAVVFEDQMLTYQELNARANQLASYLQHTLGVSDETVVGICVERSLEMIIALLGVLKAGGVYVPLDPDYPQARLVTVLKDARIRIVLTQARLLERVAATTITAFCLDTDWPAVAQVPAAFSSTAVHPAHIAYTIYTSGSTGHPKGVQVTHQALINFLISMSRDPGLASQDILLAVTSLSFDIAGLELYLPLLLGARLVIASRDLARDGERLTKALSLYGITAMQATPSTWRLLLEAGWQGSEHLRIFCGGEALPADLAQQLLEKGAALWNLYGPTETTIWSALYKIEHVRDGVPLGYPIANTRLYVLDKQWEPVPIGVAGELYIGGHGLSRGYFEQAALTAEKFLPDPFVGTRFIASGASEPGMRLYRTGDLACYRPDGTLKFLGRIDHQVKVQGFRIELQEIESTLNRHPGVYESVVSTHEEPPGEKRLVAYVVPNAEHVEEYVETDNPQERVRHWRAVWDMTYTTDTSGHDPAFNLSGWKSSYTQKAIPPDEMREWVDATIERLSAYQPQRVLEIGCGTGLLLFRLAPACIEYCATDFSPDVLAQVRQQTESLHLHHVKLLQREASDFTGIIEESYDLVVLNSVVQYFPDFDYMKRVLEGALSVVKPGGVIFLGDLRSLPLLHAFHASVQLHHTPGTTPRADLLLQVRTHAAQEEELLIAPELFTALQQSWPQISQVAIQLKRGRSHNELTQFRYDVVLHKSGGPEPTLVVEPRHLDWRQEQFTLASLRQLLQKEAPQALYISGIPNARLLAAVRAYELLETDGGPEKASDLRDALDTMMQQEPGIEPEEYWHIGTELSYAVSVTWSRTCGPGSYDVILSQAGYLASPPAQYIRQQEPGLWRSYTNAPLRKFVPQRLEPALRAYLKQYLPEYMLPAAFAFLPALPLTPNGKIDRRALPVPGYSRPLLKDAYVAPRSPTEELLAEIWSQTLGIEQIGIHDNFFEVGGNSLLVIRLVAKASRAGLVMTAKQVFLHQTIARQAEIIRTAQIVTDQSSRVGLTPPLPAQYTLLAASHPEYFNLTYVIFAQERLVFRHVHRLVQELFTYHDVLRICRAPVGSAWPLLIKEPPRPAELPCWYVDLSLFPEPEITTMVTRAMNTLQMSMDLDQGPLFQVVLFDCGPDKPSILLLIGHYLVADIEAWQILLEDVLTFYQQLATTDSIQLPTRSASFKEWAERLHSYAESEALAKEFAYWLDEARWHILPLPLDNPEGKNTIGSSSTVTTELTVQETEALLSGTLKYYQTQMDALLITAVSLTCLAWSEQETLAVNLFSHGREALFEDIDASRTVGTFGTEFPVLITLPRTIALADALQRVKAQLARVPNHGISYGILRRLSQSEQARRLRSLPEAEIVVNYIGETFHDPDQPQFAIYGPYTGHHHDQETDRGHKLQITGQVYEGKLQLRWDYSQHLHTCATIESLAQRAIEIIRSLLVFQATA